MPSILKCSVLGVVIFYFGRKIYLHQKLTIELNKLNNVLDSVSFTCQDINDGLDQLKQELKQT